MPVRDEPFFSDVFDRFGISTTRFSARQVEEVRRETSQFGLHGVLLEVLLDRICVLFILLLLLGFLGRLKPVTRAISSGFPPRFPFSPNTGADVLVMTVSPLAHAR